MTPSQSKIKTSVLSRTCCIGSDNFNTLAFSDVVLVKARRDAGANADTVDESKVGRTREANFMVGLDVVCDRKPRKRDPENDIMLSG